METPSCATFAVIVRCVPHKSCRRLPNFLPSNRRTARCAYSLRSREEVPFVITIIFYIQLGFTGAGVVANGATYFTQTYNSEHLTLLTLLLIKHLSLVDMS